MTSIFVDRQNSVQILHDDEKQIKEYCEKASCLFRKHMDTLVVCAPSGKLFVHFGPDETEVFQTRRELRQQLSKESSGAWIEQRGERKKYFLDKGWIFFQVQEVEKKEFLETQHSPSIPQKVTGIALGLLGLAPAAIEIGSRLSSSEISSKEIVLGLLALQQKNPGIALLGSHVVAQTGDPEFQVNTHTDGDQGFPDCAGLKDGGFVVVWQSQNQDGSGEGVFGQRYSRNGNLEGIEFRINSIFEEDQLTPTVTVLKDGGFLTAWVNNITKIHGRIFDGDGSAPEFTVNTDSTHIKYTPSATSLLNGGSVVLWSSLGQDENLGGVYGQRYNNLSEASGAEFQVNSYTILDQSNPSVAGLSDGGFVAVWQSFQDPGTNRGVYGQLFTNMGSMHNLEFRINTHTQAHQEFPRVAGFSRGGFVVVWQSTDQDGDKEGIFGKLYDRDGAQSGNEFQINTFIPNGQTHPDVATLLLSDGFVVVWESNGQMNGLDVYAQKYNQNGLVDGPEFLVNSVSEGDQVNPSITALTDGGFLITWEDKSGEDGSNSGIFGKRFDQAGNAVFPGTESAESSLQSSLLSTSQSSSEQQMSSSSENSPPPRPPHPSSSSTLTLSMAPSSLFSPSSTTMSLSPSNTYRPPSGKSSSPSTLPTQTEPASYTSTTSTSISFGTPHVIYVENNPIGTFTLTEGGDTTIITLEFSDDFALDDGETVTLFTFSQDNGAYENIVLNTEDGCYEINGEKYSVNGEVQTNNDGSSDYQLIFENTTCDQPNIAEIFLPMSSLFGVLSQ